MERSPKQEIGEEDAGKDAGLLQARAMYARRGLCGRSQQTRSRVGELLPYSPRKFLQASVLELTLVYEPEPVSAFSEEKSAKRHALSSKGVQGFCEAVWFDRPCKVVVLLIL